MLCAVCSQIDFAIPNCFYCEALSNMEIKRELRPEKMIEVEKEVIVLDESREKPCGHFICDYDWCHISYIAEPVFKKK